MLTPRQFLHSYKLPQVVIQKRGDKISKLLLFKCYTYLKFHGHYLDRDGIDRVRSVGPPIYIPETFPGWMTMITKNGRTAGYFLSIEQITEAGITYFFVRDSVNGYQRFPCRKRGQKYKKVTINAGEVLKYIRTYEIYSGKFMLKRQPKKYAKCVKRDGRIVLLPYETVGRFYLVANKYEFTHNHVFRISDLLRQEQLRLPLVVQIITGYPNYTKDFNRIVRLETIQPQTVILASEFRDKEPTLLEINVDSDVSFQVTRFNPTFEHLLRYCCNFADNWKNSIRYPPHQDKRFRRSFSRKTFNNLFRYERLYQSFRRRIKRNSSRISAYHLYESIESRSTNSIVTMDIPFAKNTTLITLNNLRETKNHYESIC